MGSELGVSCGQKSPEKSKTKTSRTSTETWLLFAKLLTTFDRRGEEALSELIKGKTTIMIAHRLSTLRDADQLVVIERGKVAEFGTHQELLEKEEGVYKRLYTLQEEALKSAGIRE